MLVTILELWLKNLSFWPETTVTYKVLLTMKFYLRLSIKFKSAIITLEYGNKII